MSKRYYSKGDRLQHSGQSSAQQGVALIAAMLFLTAFTIMLSSSMGASVDNAKISTITQQTRIIFLAAESAIATATGNSELMNATVLAGENMESQFMDLPDISNTITQVKMVYVGENSVPVNYSLGAGFSAIYFKAIGRSAIKNNPARVRTNIQGFYRIVPRS